MSTPFVYAGSPLTLPDDKPASTWKAAPALGAKMTDRRLVVWADWQQREVRLRHLTGSGFTVLVAVRDAARAEAVARELAQPPRSVPCRVIPVLDGLDPLRAGDALLLRPDGHLAARRHGPSSAEIGELINRVVHPLKL